MATTTTTFDLVLDSLNSVRTKDQYKFHLNRFDNWLATHKTNIKENDIIAYLNCMKLDGLSYSYRNVALAAIKHRYTMHDVLLNWRKIAKFLGERVKKNSTRAYTSDEISKILKVASAQYRAIILLYASTGMRREALVTLKASDMHYLEDYKLYKIYVYKNTPQEYVCFTTPEAADAINLYLKRYNVDKNGYFKHIRVNTMSSTLEDICDKAGIKKLDVNRNEIPAIHGFRKFCITQMAKADRDENGKPIKETRVNTEIAKLLTGHSIGVRGEYVEYTDDDSLQEYMKAIDRLTINNENRLKSELDYLKGEKDRKVKSLEEKVDKLATLFAESSAAISIDKGKMGQFKDKDEYIKVHKALYQQWANEDDVTKHLKCGEVELVK